MPSARNYSNTASTASLVNAQAATDTAFSVSTFTGFPAPPFTADVARGTASEEVVLVTNVVGSTLTVTRGYDGTAAKAQSAGATLQMAATAIDFTEANQHTTATSGVHGLAGGLVGTNDTQTLANKTLTAPTLASPTVTGTLSGAAAAFTGNVSVTGTLSVAAQLSGGPAVFSGSVSASLLSADNYVQLTQLAAAPGASGTTSRLYALTDGGVYANGAFGATRLPVHWGTRSGPPASGALIGDSYYNTGLGTTMRYTGSAWRQAEICLVADAAARTALSTAALYGGFEVVETSTQRRYVWNPGSGGVWMYGGGGAPPLTNVSWSNAAVFTDFDTISFGRVKFGKDAAARVVVQGLAKMVASVQPPYPTTLFNLPADCRPATTQMVTGFNQTRQSIVRFDVAINGDVNFQGGTALQNDFIDLGGIAFWPGNN